MKKSNIFIAFVFGTFFLPVLVFAKQLPISGIDVIIKKKIGGTVQVMHAGNDGHFVFEGLEDGNYELFLNTEETSLGVYPTKAGKLSGSLLIAIDESLPEVKAVTPVVDPVAPTAPVAPATPVAPTAPVAPVAPVAPNGPVAPVSSIW